MEPDPLTADILASAMDAVIIMDGLGRVLYWNPAAEGLFGVATGQALGCDLAELVIPENLRERHRTGLARAAAGRRGPILGRRFEVAGLRPDGMSVPIELTVTRVEHEGRTLFVGYLRDITERRRAIAELRASRRRLVAVSDETRRRLEHDLHDGAQQQLVAAAMSISAAGAALDEDLPAARALVLRAADQIQEAIAGLRELARGLHPDIVTRHGLSGAVADLARRSGIVVLIGTVEQRRLPRDVEVAAYYVLAESLTNAAKHGARTARIQVAIQTGDALGDRRHLVMSVTDDGPGGADPAAGTGLRGLVDRWAAVGGDLVVDSPVGGGTSVTARLELAADDSRGITAPPPTGRTSSPAAPADPSPRPYRDGRPGELPEEDSMV